MPTFLLCEKLLRFLCEDVGMGDITTEAVVQTQVRTHAHIIAKEPFVVAGIYETKTLFKMLGLEVVKSVGDGDKVASGSEIMEVTGDTHAILTAERTALNILMRMSGIATSTKKLIEKVKNCSYKGIIAATRKTAPGLQYFDKRAVFLGGGETHRFQLDDAILIKNNHIKVGGGIEKAIEKARTIAGFIKKIEIEVETIEEAVRAAVSGVDIIMLDNMSPSKIMETMQVLRRRDLRNKVLVEISGGITEDNIIEYAECEPDIISIGSLTHSVKSVDISLKIEVEKSPKDDATV